MGTLRSVPQRPAAGTGQVWPCHAAAARSHPGPSIASLFAVVGPDTRQSREPISMNALQEHEEMNPSPIVEDI